MEHPDPPATPRERFLAALLASARGTAEEMQAARKLAGEWLDAAGASEEKTTSAAERFERADRRKFKKLRRFARPTLALGAAVALLTPVARPLTEHIVRGDLDNANLIFGSFSFWCQGFTPILSSLYDENEPAYQRALVRGLTPRQALVLRGNPAIQPPSRRAEALWRDHFPDDPAFFHEFLRQLDQKSAPVLENASKTAEGIDPENGFAALAGANHLAIGVFARKRGTPPGSPREYELRDKERLARCLALFHKAARKPVCTQRIDELERKRTSPFQPTGNPSTHMARYLRDSSNGWSFFDLSALAFTLRHEAERLSRTGERRAMSRLVDDWLKVSRALASNRDNPSESYNAFILLSCTKPFLLACRALNLDEEAEILASIRNRSNAPAWQTFVQTNLRNNKALENQMSALARENVSKLGVVAVRPPDLTYGRMAEYANFDWLALRAAGLLLLGLGGLAAVLWRFLSPPSWRFGKHLARILSATDWWLILGIGVAVPLAWHGLVTSVPAFRSREFGVWASEQIQPSVQAGATFLFVLAALFQTSRWRLARRLEVLGVSRARYFHLGWLPVLFAALALPVTAFPSFSGIDWTPAIAKSPVFDSWSPRIWPFLPSLALLTSAVVLLFLFLMASLAGRAGHTPLRAAAAYVFASAGAPAVLLLALVASPLVRIELCHWLSKDPVTDIRSEWNGQSRYGFSATRVAQQHMLQVLWEKTHR
jgi:hypothetical protein